MKNLILLSLRLKFKNKILLHFIMSREIDYLPEDNSIPGQRYALLSIVGPHMRQKCDTWGVKVRGIVDTIDQAKALSKKIINYDNDFDIFTAEVGKFFPLNVDPLQVDEVEYQNEQLNTLMKKYYQNKEDNTQQWNERKQEMTKSAIKEGLSPNTESKDHPVVVLQRINDSTDRITELTEKLENENAQLQKSRELYLSYSVDERDLAEKIMSGDVMPNDAITGVESAGTLGLAPIIEEEDTEDTEDVIAVLDKLRITDEHIDKLESAENYHAASSDELSSLKKKKSELLSRLDTKTVNEYINKNYKGSEHNYLLDNSPR
jgi:hypothetical protein